MTSLALAFTVVTLALAGAMAGFFFAALGGLVRTAFSDYRKLRAQYGLSTYSAVGITALVEAAGFEGVTRRTNFGHNPHRMAFSARKALTVPEIAPQASASA